MSKIRIICALLLLTAVACNNPSKSRQQVKRMPDFDMSELNQELLPAKMLRGQLVYLPVYSNVPYQIDTIKFDMSAFIAIHNTDLLSPVRLTKVLYFDQEGKLVNDYLKNITIEIPPLATRDFYVPYDDQSGTGANFLIEWVSDTLVNEPLIESVTVSLKPNNTAAILSQGKVIREKR